MLPVIILAVGYFSVLFIFTTGISGLQGVGETKSDLEKIVFNINLLIVLIHLPLIYILYKARLHKPNIKRAREVFDQDISHLEDHQVHEHLKSKH